MAKLFLQDKCVEVRQVAASPPVKPPAIFACDSRGDSVPDTTKTIFFSPSHFFY
jgi:hypothetical protein